MSPCRLLNNILKDKDGEEWKLFFRWRWKVLEFKITIEGVHIISCLWKGHLGKARWSWLARTVGKYDKQPLSINSRQLFITKEGEGLPVEKPDRHQCHSKWAVLVLFTSCAAFWRHNNISTSLQGDHYQTCGPQSWVCGRTLGDLGKDSGPRLTEGGQGVGFCFRWSGDAPHLVDVWNSRIKQIVGRHFPRQSACAFQVYWCRRSPRRRDSSAWV